MPNLYLGLRYAQSLLFLLIMVTNLIRRWNPLEYCKATKKKKEIDFCEAPRK